MTNSRELVRQTLEFDNPSRLPRHLWTLPWAEERYPEMFRRIQDRFPDDIAWCPNLLTDPPETTGNFHGVGIYIDEWGNVFENLEEGIVGEVKQPVLVTWDDVEKLRFPTGRLTVDVDQVNAFCRQTDQFVITSAPIRPFETLQFLRGSENLFIDLALEPPELPPLLDRIHQFFVDEFHAWVQTDVDALFFQDDWGAQNNLLISPDTWRRLFKPLYKEYIEIAHSHGKYALMHSDGNIEKIYPDLVELGLDAINSQIFIMDTEALAEQFAGKITFWGELDRQQVMSYGTPEQVDQAVRQFKELFYRDGGVIAQGSFGVGVNPTNVEQLFKSWEEQF